MKEKSKGSATHEGFLEALKPSDPSQLFADTRPNLGTHKSTKLQRALGKKADTTLLSSTVAEKHAQQLEREFQNAYGKLSKSQAAERLRFVTILHDVVPLDVGEIAKSTKSLRELLERCIARTKRDALSLIGAIEIEVINMEFMRKRARTSKGEQRKLHVLERMLAASKPGTDPSDCDNLPNRGGGSSFALVHIHALVDLGDDEPARTEQVLDSVLRRVWNLEYQIEIKSTFKHRKLTENFSDMARYMTKGGNDDLRYSTRFGRNSSDPDKLEQQMFRAGKISRSKDEDEKKVLDASSLTHQELEILGASLNRLMGKGAGRDGYLVRLGKQATKQA